MLGSIIGDIIGSTYELRPVKRTDFPLFPQGSRFTDDSVLTAAVAEVLLGRKAAAERTAEWQKQRGATVCQELRPVLQAVLRPLSRGGLRRTVLPLGRGAPADGAAQLRERRGHARRAYRFRLRYRGGGSAGSPAKLPIHPSEPGGGKGRPGRGLGGVSRPMRRFQAGAPPPDRRAVFL